MTTSPHSSPQDDPPPGPGLKLRLWLACLSGGSVAGLGSLWVLGTRVTPGSANDGTLLPWLTGVALLALLTGVGFALWLDHHVSGQLRGLLNGARTGRAAEMRGLPAHSGWGELSDLAEAMQSVLARQRQLQRAGVQLEQQRLQLETLLAAIERWQRTETWEGPALADGDVATIADRLGHALSRRAGLDAQHREAAGLVAAELAEALGDAQESAEQAERGFVEATALLTTVRELQRLSGELGAAIASPSAPAAPPTDVGEAARTALEELVTSSSAAVEALGRGLRRVEDVAEQVQRLANRATLVAIQALTSTATSPVSEDLKQLAHDVRDATERTSQFAMDIDAAVNDAGSRMRESRTRALARLESLPSREAAARPARAAEDAARLLERVREMVQDAARKGEQLSAAGERASRSAERLARRLQGGALEAEALATRLAPVGEAAPGIQSTPGLQLVPAPATEADALEGHPSAEDRHEERP